VTVIPPEVLVAGGVGDADAVITEEIQLSQKALAGVMGRGGDGLQEVQRHVGVEATVVEPKEGETLRRLVLRGAKGQVKEAKSMIDQKVVLAIGEKKAEKMHKHLDTLLLEKKRAETGSDAAKIGVKGLSDFCQKWGVKAVMARKLARLDAQTQRYMIKHFYPKKAKPVNALRAYVVGLLKPPQRWRLEALYEDGELDGEICETFSVGEHGAIVGRGGAVGEGEHAADEDAEAQRIELEVDDRHGEQATRVYGDVQPQHCRLMRMGGNFYAWALETQIGTLVDGQKYRQNDGPVAIRDGSIVGVGKYLLYCEVGAADALQHRRARLLAGERLWKTNKGAQQSDPAAAAATAVADVPQADGQADQCAGDAGNEDPLHEPAAAAGTGKRSLDIAPAADAAIGAVAASPGATVVAEQVARPGVQDQTARRAAADADDAPAAKRRARASEAQVDVAGAAADAQSGASGGATASREPAAVKRGSAAAAAAAYEAAFVASAAGSQPPPPNRRGSAAAAAAAYEAALAETAAGSEPPPAKRRSSVAAAVAACEAATGAAPATEAEAADREEEDAEDGYDGEADPMQELMKQLGLPSGFG